MLHPPHTLEIGLAPYWNLLPFKQELLQAGYGNIHIQEGHPTELNERLQQGQLHLAPCSSICLATQSDFEMALALGIASNGPVQSVYLAFKPEHAVLYQRIQERHKQLQSLFQELLYKSQGYDARRLSSLLWEKTKSLSNTPLSSCPPLVLSGASASSAVLTRLLYVLWFGHDSYQTMSSTKFAKVYEQQQPIELLIGDEALIKRCSFYKTLDLGSLWKDLTGLPFVFAVWQSKGAFLNGFRRKIMEIGEKAEMRMKGDPLHYMPEPQPKNEQQKNIALAEYWRCIQYRLGPEEMKGLLLFLCLGRKVLQIPMDTEIFGKIMRWQELCQPGQRWSIGI